MIILTNANVYTNTYTPQGITSLAIKNGKIAAIGSDKEILAKYEEPSLPAETDQALRDYMKNKYGE